MLTTIYHVQGAGAGGSLVTAGEVLMIVALAVIYLLGLVRARALGAPGATVRVSSFVLGFGMLTIALVSPLSDAADRSLSAHMAQHTLLLLAPLALLGGKFGVRAIQAVPVRWRGTIAVPMRSAARRATPLSTFALVAGAVVFWHIPAVFEPAASDAWVHAFEHWTLLVAAGLYWGAVLGYARSSPGLALGTLMALLMFGGAIGALLTFSTRPWYPGYAERAGSEWLVDQQLAGVIMWIPMGIVIMGLGAWVTATGLKPTSESAKLLKKNPYPSREAGEARGPATSVGEVRRRPASSD